MFGERDRYGRRTVRDQLEELGDWARRHRLGLVLLLVVAAVLVWLFTPGQPVRPQDLAVGDCLYVRTASADDVGAGARPIGEAGLVEAAILSGSAIRVGCGESHGHEVSATQPLPSVPSESPGQSAHQAACDAAFDGYVGRGLDDSVYATFAVVPSAAAWDAGVRNAICLVARRDGQWMDGPARASGE